LGVVRLLRLVARLAALLLLIALALLGLATAIFAIQGGRAALSLPALARHLQLPQLRASVGGWLARLAAHGATDSIALVGGLVAIATGVLLLVGIFVRARERLVLFEQDEQGWLMARPKPLSQIAAALVGQARGVTVTRARVRARRRGIGGTLRLRASHVASLSNEEAIQAISQALLPLTESFALSPRLTTKPGRERVQ
jgi:hypothetical protein